MHNLTDTLKPPTDVFIRQSNSIEHVRSFIPAAVYRCSSTSVASRDDANPHKHQQLLVQSLASIKSLSHYVRVRS